MADGPQKTDFWIPKKFLFRPFFDLFSNMMDRKNAPSQKSCLAELQTAAGNPILRIDV